MQTFGATQSAFDVQVVRHMPPVPHMNAPHDMVVTVWQAPVPLQVRAGVHVDPGMGQLDATQVVPAA
jgi:hypothetical protein